MKGLLARRPSPAMIIAVLALTMAMIGTAFAALGKNTVGSKQLKKNAVITAKVKKEAITGGKVKKLSLTGTQVDVSKLGTVPSATHASSADSIPPAEATHLVGAPGEPAFEGGSSNYVPGGVNIFNPVGFYKDHEGIVHLQGIAQVGKSGSITSIFTLPPGFRPAAGKLVVIEQVDKDAAVIGGSSTILEGVDLSGKVAGSEEKLAVLDGITFRAES